MSLQGKTLKTLEKRLFSALYTFLSPSSALRFNPSYLTTNKEILIFGRPLSHPHLNCREKKQAFLYLYIINLNIWTRSFSKRVFAVI